MVAKENRVYEAAMQFCRVNKEPIPETVIYGYAKLLRMDEKQVRMLLPDDCMDDIESAHKWFSENKLDLDLIKSGLSLVVPLIPQTVDEKKRNHFLTYMDSEETHTSSRDILTNALNCAFVPLVNIFGNGNDIDSVFSYIATLKLDYPSREMEENSGENSKEDEQKKTADEEKNESQKGNEHPIAESQNSSDEQAACETEADDANGAEEIKSLGTLSTKYRELNMALLDVVKGQEQAILRFIQGYNQGELLSRTEEDNRPKTYFFFFGPPGVGKTLLAQTAAEALGIPHRIFNMSEYAGHQSHEELLGAAQMYSGAKEGDLVKFVRKNPKSVLIFDEIEKAHINVIRQFLQILSSGILHNKNIGNDVSFKDTIIIFTSNVGRELYADRSVNLTTLPEKVIIDSIQKEKNEYGNQALPPEICSRIAAGNTVMFNHLSIRHIVEIVRANFDKVVAGMEQEHGVHITYAKELPLLFLYSRGDGIDARVASGQSEKFMKDEIYELIRHLGSNKVDGNEIKSIHIDIEWEGMEPELERLFKNNEKAEVLVLSDQAELFDAVENTNYKINRVSSYAEARDFVYKNDIAAVYIDPFYGSSDNDESVLSISDYNTDGVKLFYDLVENQAGLPIYLLEMNHTFSEVDRRTFLQEGAVGTAHADGKHAESFKRQFIQMMEELYMEKESQTFSQRGYVIDYNTKQELTQEEGSVKIVFYHLKKRMAIDVESRGSILSDASKPNVRFKDVIGAEKAKEELQYFVKYLQNPKQFLMSGGRPPKGVLLYGPPGTGKTMLAKAMAGESDVRFLQTSATEFMNQYVGESEANIRRLFARAKKYAPSIIFIDEIDAIGKKRTGRDTVTESMLNALLTEMDGFSSTDSSKPVFVLAATNYGAGETYEGISSLDDALIRRFDNKIYVDLPKEKERKEYILLTLKKKEIDTVSEDTVQNIAERTTGQSLAILQNVIELAIRNATTQGRKLEDSDLLTALEDYIFGEKREHKPEYYYEVAVHETGHAFVSYISGDKPSYITIEARGDFGGYIRHANPEEINGYTREDLIARIRTALAGRAAEAIFFGEQKSLNTGASSDLQQATNLAWHMICSYGMEKDQLIVLTKEEVLQSTMASEYVAKVNDILKTELRNTTALLEENKGKLQEIVNVLVKENRLTGAQFEELMEKE